MTEPHEKYARFVADHIDSIGKLEILLLLHGQGSRSWTTEAVSTELRSSEFSVRKHLDELLESGLVAVGPGEPKTYRFAPDSAEKRSLVDGLSDYYRQYRVTVIEWMYAAPKSSIRDFADAFKIRKDKP